MAETLRQIEHDSDLAKCHAAATADPAPFVAMIEPPKNSYASPQLPAGAVFLGDRNRYSGLKITPAKHRKCPGHAITVVDPGPYSSPRVAYLCTDPKKHHAADVKKDPGLARALGVHRAGSGPLTDTEKAARKAKREHNAALAEAMIARRTFLRQVLKRAVPATDAIAAILEAWAALRPWQAFGKEGTLATSLLALNVGDPKGRFAEDVYGRHHAAITVYATKSAANAARAVLAVSFEQAEAWIERGVWREDVVKSHYARLERLGYKPAPAERLELTGKAPR